MVGIITGLLIKAVSTNVSKIGDTPYVEVMLTYSGLQLNNYLIDINLHLTYERITCFKAKHWRSALQKSRHVLDIYNQCLLWLKTALGLLKRPHTSKDSFAVLSVFSFFAPDRRSWDLVQPSCCNVPFLFHETFLR